MTRLPGPASILRFPRPQTPAGRLRTNGLRLLRYYASGRWFWGNRLFRRFGLLSGRQDGVEGCAFHAGHELDDTGIAHVLNEPVDDGVTKFPVSHLPALEAKGCLYLVAFSQKTDGLVFLGLVIVLIHGHRKFDFLDGDDFLLLSSRALALVFLVKEFAVILNSAYRRLR